LGHAKTLWPADNMMSTSQGVGQRLWPAIMTRAIWCVCSCGRVLTCVRYARMCALCSQMCAVLASVRCARMCALCSHVCAVLACVRCASAPVRLRACVRARARAPHRRTHVRVLTRHTNDGDGGVCSHVAMCSHVQELTGAVCPVVGLRMGVWRISIGATKSRVTCGRVCVCGLCTLHSSVCVCHARCHGDGRLQAWSGPASFRRKGPEYL